MISGSDDVIGVCGIVSGDTVPRTASLRRMATALAEREGALELREATHVTLGQLVSARGNGARASERSDRSRMVVADARIDGPDPCRAIASLASVDVSRAGETLRDLLGDFALAIWAPDEGALVCARDPLGVRPLYYCHLPHLELFAFASTVRALLQLEEVPKTLNRVRVAEYLNGLHPDHESTFYDAVRRLPAAHWLRYQRGQLRLERYWAPDPHRGLAGRTDSEHEEAFRSVFVEAVRCRMDTHGRTASTLSGGLDSSSVSSVAGHLAASQGKAIDTFSAVFPELDPADLRRIDERDYQAAVARQPGLRAHQVVFDDPNPLEHLDRHLRVLDGPCVPFNLYMHDRILERAHESGARVLLDGIDGDSVISFGLGRLTELAKRLRWVRLWQEARALAAHSPRKQFSAAYFVRELGFRPLVPAALRRLRWRWRLRAGAIDEQTLLRPELARELRLDERWRDRQLDSIRSFQSEREEHARGLGNPILPFALELAQACSTFHGLRMSFPFLDRRVVEMCVALPSSQKLRNGVTRSILRRSLTDFVPQKITQRLSKANLEPAFRSGLARHGPQRTTELLAGDLSVVDEYVDTTRLESGMSALASGSTAAPLRLFEGLSTAIWLQGIGP